MNNSSNETPTFMYEVINKATREVTPCNLAESDTNNEGGAINNTVIVRLEDGSELTFNNPNSEGKLFNEEYAIRQSGSKAQADGVGFVNDAGVEVDTKEEADAVLEEVA